MGNLLSRIFPSNKEYRLLMIGLDAAGKTSILYKLRLNENINTIPTIGFNVETVQYNNLEFNVWDVGGQDNIRPLWKYYYSVCGIEGSHAVIFVVDSIDRQRIDEARFTLHKVLEAEELNDAALLILANKQDLPNAMTPAEMSEKLDLHKLRRNWYLQPSIATTGDGLYEGLDWVSRTLSGKKTKPHAPSKFSQQVCSKDTTTKFVVEEDVQPLSPPQLPAQSSALSTYLLHNNKPVETSILPITISSISDLYLEASSPCWCCILDSCFGCILL